MDKMGEGDFCSSVHKQDPLTPYPTVLKITHGLECDPVKGEEEKSSSFTWSNRYHLGTIQGGFPFQ